MIVTIHPENPQFRLVDQVVRALQLGAVVVYPTESGYALGCGLDNKEAAMRICRIRQLDSKHNFTLMCRDLSHLSSFARVDNPTFRILKAHTPGPYTFILNASKEVPKRLQNAKRKTIGLRVPDHKVVQSILDCLGDAMMSVTLIMPGEVGPLCDVAEINSRLGKRVDIVIDAGYCGNTPTSVIDLSGDFPEILRRGQGDVSNFEEER